MIHLDTSFLIRALVRQTPEDEVLRAWIVGGEDLRISAVSWAEFLCGPVSDEDAARALRIVHEPIAFGGRDPSEAARLFNSTGRRRGSFGDCMIAASALNAGADLATANEEDFDRFEESDLTVLTASRVLAERRSPDEDSDP